MVKKLIGMLPDLPLASCKGLDTELFFSDDMFMQPNPTVQAICNLCPETANCLSWAMSNGESGVWGATTSKQRAALKRGIMRLRCPGCANEAIMETPATAANAAYETCLSCGLSWTI